MKKYYGYIVPGVGLSNDDLEQSMYDTIVQFTDPVICTIDISS